MQHVVSEIKRGSIETYRAFFEGFYPTLCAFAFRYIQRREPCKDISQEALLLYWERRADFDQLFQVKSFLYPPVRNRCLNLLKREEVNRNFVQESLLESEEFHEEGLIEQETYLLVRQAVGALPTRMRAIIEQAMDGMTNPQIARKMGISEGTVHALKKTAYRKLRTRLKHLYLIFILSM
ncbi:MAG: sigma-70 family RNA polymerase sigma factor [Odoribacteraceae bacterium]|jgi:RNA polymerase sigma-70 factor (ECF subfamily)|nr:sigma-70 family RNA polymerase sigma factor [Odoribacteraceae bacterium]